MFQVHEVVQIVHEVSGVQIVHVLNSVEEQTVKATIVILVRKDVSKNALTFTKSVRSSRKGAEIIPSG